MYSLKLHKLGLFWEYTHSNSRTKIPQSHYSGTINQQWIPLFEMRDDAPTTQLLFHSGKFGETLQRKFTWWCMVVRANHRYDWKSGKTEPSPQALSLHWLAGKCSANIKRHLHIKQKIRKNLCCTWKQKQGRRRSSLSQVRKSTPSNTPLINSVWLHTSAGWL